MKENFSIPAQFFSVVLWLLQLRLVTLAFLGKALLTFFRAEKF